MKRIAFFSISLYFASVSFCIAQIHEKPVIADYVPNIPEELFQSGKLSKFVTLSVPDDERWNPDNINPNANGAVYAIELGDNFRTCYVGGHFDSIGGVAAKRLAYFNGYPSGGFTEVGGGIQGGDVYAIVPLYDGELYVAGNFTQVGNLNVHGIAHWTGTLWEDMGGGMDSTILTLAFNGVTLYAGGNFHHAGGTEANYIAKWDTSVKVWQPIMDGSINGMDGGIATLVSDQYGDLYAGGGFTKAGSISANKIALFSNEKWSNMQSGVNGLNSFVSAITLEGYIGGNFQNAGGVSVNNIAFWDGNKWSSTSEFPKGFDGPVYTIATPSGIFVGGDFHKSGDTLCNYIASSGPSILGSGLDGPCYALAGKFIYVSVQSGLCNRLFVGGKFNNAGQKVSQNFAIWAEHGCESVEDSKKEETLLSISPNPVQTSSTLKFSLSERANISISIIDPLGRIVKSLGSGWHETGTNEIRFDVTTLPDGIYFCQLQFGGQFVSTPLIVVR